MTIVPFLKDRVFGPQDIEAMSTAFEGLCETLNLPDEAKEALTRGKISEGHARAILSLKGDPERQAYLLKAIIEHGWNVRQAERFVVSVKSGISETKKAHARTQTETTETKKLGQKLGTNVQIRRMAHGGKLEISFSSDKDLERIFRLFD